MYNTEDAERTMATRMSACLSSASVSFLILPLASFVSSLMSAFKHFHLVSWASHVVRVLQAFLE